jgi:hypothetical protein
MVIKNGKLADADEVMDKFNFGITTSLNYALDGATTTNQDNMKVDLFSSDTAQYLEFMKYNAGTDLYECIDSSSQAWIIIEASSITEAQLEINNCTVVQISSSKWMLLGSSGDYETSRAEIMKTLFYGSDGSDPRVVSGITGLSALKTPDSNDVGKRAHYVYSTHQDSALTTSEYRIDGTFTNTSTNTDCSAWSYCYGTENYATSRVISRFQFAAGNTVNSITTSAGSPDTVTSDETGTDTSADELDNPADCNLYISVFHSASGNGGNGIVRSIILCVGSMSWEEGIIHANGAYGNTDFYTDNSIPDFTTATESDLTCRLTTGSTTITTNETEVIMKSIKSLTGSNTCTAEVTFDDGSNWKSITEKVWTQVTDTGTAMRFRFTITRANNDEEDSITSYAAYYK